MIHKTFLIAAIGAIGLTSAALADDPPQPAQPQPQTQRVQIKIAPPPGAIRKTIDFQPAQIEGGYAVVVSQTTYDHADWKKVADTLVAKNGGEVVTYEKDVNQAREALARIMPRYTCFVATPEEAGRQFVVAIHRMTRKLDDDPYTDTQWGIITGVDHKAAMWHAAYSKPLTIKRALGTTGVPHERFEQSLVISDGKCGKINRNNVSEAEVPAEEGETADRARVFVDAMHNIQPDLLMTSWHATERDIQMPLKPQNGQLRCRNGMLFGLSLTERAGWAIFSPNPKVHLAVGNCLLGRIDGKDAIALAFMNSGGVNQLVAYVVSTWYGRGGWGVRPWFYTGQFTAAESWYINNQTLAYDLHHLYPQSADFQINQWNIETNPRLIGRIAAQLGYTNTSDPKQVKDHVGLLWDIDTVALYGDPAWRAMMPPDPDPAYKQQLSVEDGQYTLSIEVLKDQKKADFFAFLPNRIDAKTMKITAGENCKPVITDNFIMLRGLEDLKANQKIEIRFTAEAIVDLEHKAK